MATETTIILVDDIDGSDAAETVRFGLDGRDYEIDLSETNAKELRASLAGFIESGRRTGGKRPARKQGGTAPARPDKEQMRAIREWARAHDYSVKDRGRIPAKVMQAYHQAR